MWAQRFDRPLKDIFAVQDEIVGKIVTTLGLIFKLDRIGRWSPMRSTDNLEAFDDLLRAVQYVRAPGRSVARTPFTKDDERKARHWLEKAIALDPNYAQAYALLAWTYWWDAWNLWSPNPQADWQHSRELAQKALALDDSNPDALGVLTRVDFFQGLYDQAIDEAEHAVASDPNYAMAYDTLSDALNAAGRAGEAVRAAEKAMRIDPLAGDFYAYALGDALVEMGRYQEAVIVLKRHLAVYPDNLVAHLFMVVAYAELGHDRDAHAEAAEIMRISPHFGVASISNARNVVLDPHWVNDWRKAGLK
jgi:adenylate cyclase